MATTVIAAFNEFMKDTVNLEKADTDDARASRDWLIGKINDFENDEVFPVSYPGIHIAFGSFARRTKIRPLDDIDLMFGLTGQGATYTILSDRVTVTSSGEGSRLHRYRHSGADTVCSVRILNAFKSRLQDITQYAQADIRRNQEAVTLKLVSKDWNFDIVPCFITSEDAYGKTYYLIPDGNGHWKFTDPRIDRDRVKAINVKNDGNVLNVIRAVKYWQRRSTMPSMSSYLLETLVLDYYAGRTSCLSFVDMELEALFNHLGLFVKYSVNDPKGIQGDINTLSMEDRQKISDRCYLDAQRAAEARQFERDNDHEKSINKWQEVFGPHFPAYG
ncbi:TPA: nucleotidyltransferase [Klebsiella pneumoniae subsp. pneumoniae]|uniref:nucleotidyltransferase n=1 Tax=Klebsiella pneumoniae TaxID=573 RepID=UPI002244D45F|nr:nucleotidyltransferase [Klebsiella pneumoniae]HDU4451991.1 nucleotidyltransferase [Klebsiella pneumoniae subsp. pneumoniae]WPG80652.1 nucleotidyltransferase [Klebsiella pneumoniae]WPG85988.1 nucleotidyltransferase [Klebsiella pneumoniae]WPG91405.1 nucleotidyltransferase [Klebsiella pneumoniae]WPG96850.1 nucleotidyltransferase [Klebsiella pneumoniae]